MESVTKQEKIRTLHLRPVEIVFDQDDFPTGRPAPKGGLTIAYQKQEDGSLRFTVARCNAKDYYRRELGRKIAHGRFVSGDYFTTLPAIAAESEDDNTYRRLHEYVHSKKELRRALRITLVGQ